MAHAEQISTLRRRRNNLIGRMTLTKRQLDEYEESGRVNKNYLISCRRAFDENWMKIIAVQESEFQELESLDKGESERLVSSAQEYHHIDARIPDLLEQSHIPPPSQDSQNASSSTSPNRHRLNYRRYP